MKSVTLYPGKEKSVLHRHPWLFSSAIMKTGGTIEPGETVSVLDHKGNMLAVGYYNSRSQIAVRILEWGPQATIDEVWWHNKINESIQRRNGLLSGSGGDSCRLVYAEADLLPGLIADKYGDYIVVQSLTVGIERNKRLITECLDALLRPAGIIEKPDAEVRKLEGLPMTGGLLKGKEPPENYIITENGIQYTVDISGGQKTGFFLDQRENRKTVSNYSPGMNVLDCFSYTGGFALSCLKKGAANVTVVDSSAPALGLYRKNLELNSLIARDEFIIEGDVFQVLRGYRDNGMKFDMVILDPPKLAPTKAHLKKAQRAYKDINLIAMKILKPGGILASFSCSGGVSIEDFRTLLSWSATDAGRETQVLETLTQPPDHPVRLSYSESAYLKGFICRVL